MEKVIGGWRRGAWRPFGYASREGKDLFYPFPGEAERDLWYGQNCLGCLREFPLRGVGWCSLVVAVWSGILTPSELGRIGGTVKHNRVGSYGEYDGLADCKERPNPVLPVK